MKTFASLFFLLAPCLLLAQDSTMNTLMNEMDTNGTEKNKPVKIFNTIRTVNANTTEMTGKGKMDFRVTHNFDDIDGKGGILGRFLGLDASKDIRIGFHVGLSDRFDVHVARVKGAGNVSKLYELGFKFLLAQQRENDPKHPLSIALFVNAAVSATKASGGPGLETSYRSFSDRLNQTVQLIVARKFGKISLQINPTFVHTNYVVSNDQNSLFAVGGAIRFPVTRNFNIILDYFHPFRSEASKDHFKTVDNTYNPPSDISFNPAPIRFYDPLGVSFEITTSGHVFNLNFTNATEILENRFIPRTISSWSKGKFRWGFTISRKFSLWRSKSE
jgi:hypothetical protein